MRSRNELTAAREELQPSRVIRERLLGEKHPMLATTWNELAALASERRDSREALRCSRLTTEIAAMQFGPDSPRVIRARLTEAGMRAERLQKVRQKDPALDVAATELDLEVLE